MRRGKLSSIRTPQIPSIGKHITRNEDGGFDMYYDSRYIGSRRTLLEAEWALDEFVFELLHRTRVEVADSAAAYDDALMAA